MIEHMSGPRGPLACLAGTDGVLAIITATEGTSYRDVGSVMAFGAAGQRTGSLSSGCIEDDLAEHASRAMKQNQPVSLRYGTGSPFFDLKLPCGGGMSVLLVANPDKRVLTQVLEQTRNRQPTQLVIDMQSGAVSAGDSVGAHSFTLNMDPEVRFMVFGQGVEANIFARLAAGAGFEVDLFGYGADTDGSIGAGRIHRHAVASFRGFRPPDPDRWTAVTLFFHDHEHEAGILSQFLGSEAFYIGAQGSRRAKDRLLAELRARGLGESQLRRFRDKFGLIPSCRDPRTLAISVLSDVLDVAAQPRAKRA